VDAFDLAKGIEWQEATGHRLSKLILPEEGQVGFTQLATTALGIQFTNRVSRTALETVAAAAALARHSAAARLAERPLGCLADFQVGAGLGAVANQLQVRLAQSRFVGTDVAQRLQKLDMDVPVLVLQSAC